MKKVNIKKAVLWGIVVLVIDMVVGNLLYMNPLVSGTYAQYADHPSTKPMEAFGGLGVWLGLTMGFGIFLEELHRVGVGQPDDGVAADVYQRRGPNARLSQVVGRARRHTAAAGCDPHGTREKPLLGRRGPAPDHA